MIFENFRDENGNYSSDENTCSLCEKQSEVYKVLKVLEHGYLMLCKTCLSNFIKEIDDAYIKKMSETIVSDIRDAHMDDEDFKRGA